MSRRRKITAAIAGFSLLVGGSVAYAQTTGLNLAKAVANTMYAACMRNYSSAVTCADEVAKGSAVLASLTSPPNWWTWFDYKGWEWPIDLGRPGYGGGGSDADNWCDDFEYRLDASGNLVVPSLPVSTGKAMSRSTHSATVRVSSGAPFGLGGDFQASDDQALARWLAHSGNLPYSEKRRWVGVRSISSASPPIFHYSSVSYIDGAGTLIARRNASSTSNNNAFFYVSSNSLAKDCPQAAGGGGDFHFYLQGADVQKMSACHEYAPNFGLSKSGYAYADVVALHRSEVTAYMDSVERAHGQARFCELDQDVIRRIAQEIWFEAASKPGYDGPGAKPVLSEDVRHGDYPPTVEDLKDPPTSLPPANPEAPAPEPTPTPTPTPTGSTDAPWTDPALNDPTAPTIDWWPDLPTIEVDLGSPACPTYQLDLAGFWDEPFVVDSHCPIVEQNRAIISALMISLFTMMSVFIVLRA